MTKNSQNLKNRMWEKLKDNWFFIRQDIVSYSISTALYIGLCLIRSFTLQTALYAIFDSFVFYIPFWYIRINFADTYHSDNWNHCKKWTRIMLCTGVTMLWLLPVKYSLFNGLFVAFACCLVLYLVSLETNRKKLIAKQNDELQAQITELLAKEVSPRDKLLQLCADKHISERNTKVAVMYYIDRMTPKQIWYWLCDNNEQMEYDSVYTLLNRLNKKLKY